MIPDDDTMRAWLNVTASQGEYRNWDELSQDEQAWERSTFLAQADWFRRYFSDREPPQKRADREGQAAAWDECQRAELSWNWQVTLNRLGLGPIPDHPPRNPYRD